MLTYEAVTAVVSNSPADRYSALLQVTGLEVPDLKSRTGAAYGRDYDISPDGRRFVVI